jgi:uncharacterized protein
MSASRTPSSVTVLSTSYSSVAGLSRPTGVNRAGCRADTSGVSGLAALAVIAAGFAAGAINSVVGSGSLLTFPALLAAGYTPLVATVSNTVGLVFGSVSGVVGYRRELIGQRQRILALGAFSIAGGVAGAALLLLLPPTVFQRVVPALVLLSVILVILQPRLSRAVAKRENHKGHAIALRAGIFACGTYGGYFAAAQSVLVLGVLGILVNDAYQRLNALKNVLVALVNGVAASVFVFRAPVAWEAVLLIAVSSVVGGQVGAHYGRRLPASVLRGVIVVAGLAVVVKLLV